MSSKLTFVCGVTYNDLISKTREQGLPSRNHRPEYI